jgi:DNA (cytosine-5)-methyltransferase 1
MAYSANANLCRTEQPIGQLSSTSVIHEQSVRFLSSDFAWTEKQVPNSVKIHLKYDLNNSGWTITAHRDDIWTEENQYVIEVSPALGYEGWILGTSEVKLCARQIDRYLFTALWKAFEEKLIEVTGMADLVQLSGYYQYKARISGSLTFHPTLNVEPFWRVCSMSSSGNRSGNATYRYRASIVMVSQGTGCVFLPPVFTKYGLRSQKSQH